MLLPQGRQQCACTSETLNFTCTIVGSGVTQWDGTAFDCTNTANEILLLHDNYPNDANGRCNGGQITGKSLSVENNCYTSLLSVSTSAALNNKSIRCNEVGQMVSIGERVLTVISGKKLDTMHACGVLNYTCPEVRNCDGFKFGRHPRYQKALTVSASFQGPIPSFSIIFMLKRSKSQRTRLG